MSLSLWLSLAGAGTALYAREPLTAGEPVGDEQVYALELPDALDIDGALTGPRSAVIGRAPRVDLPADTRLFPHHFDGGPEVAVALPAPGSVPAVGDRVDLWVAGDRGWCRLVDGAPVSARDGDRVTLWVPADRAEGLPERSPALVLRHPLDPRPAAGAACEEAP